MDRDERNGDVDGYPEWLLLLLEEAALTDEFDHLWRDLGGGD